MKVRLYRATGEAKNYIDGYTLYFPYPKWYQKELRKLYPSLLYCPIGCFVGCSPASDGEMIRCSWDEMDGRYTFAGLGRKVKIETMPEPFQREVRRLETLYNDALKYNDEGHWEAFNEA
jgi:hypothetical protein